MSERRLWVLFGVLVVAGLVIGLVLGQPRRLLPKLAIDLPTPRPQTAEDRILAPPPFELVAHVSAGPAHPLVRPRLVQAAADGTAWVFDYADMALKRVSPDGTVEVTSARNDAGEVPFRNPTDLVRGLDGGLWLPDPAAQRLFLLASDGTFLRSIPLRDPALRWVVSSSGRSFALTPMTGGAIFQSFDDPAASPLARFGTLLEPRYQMPYTLDGSLAADAHGGFVYAPRYVGLLAGYGADGGLRYLVETLDPVGPPVLVSENGRLRGDPEAPVATLSVHAIGDGIATVHREATSHDTFVDLYSSADGAYRRSWRIERAWVDFDVMDGRLYALGADGLTIFRLLEDP